METAGVIIDVDVCNHELAVKQWVNVEKKGL